MLCGAPHEAHSAGGRGVLEAQDPLDLAQLGIGVLEQGRPLDQHVDADAVADRHLVDESTEVPLQLGHPRLEDVAPALEVDDLALGRRAERA